MLMRRNEYSSDHAVAGAVSGFMTRLTCQPIDVIKIRFQLQVEPISHDHPSKYRSILQATRTIIKEEGIFSLWKGHAPAQLLSIAYGTAQFYTYNKIMEVSRNFVAPDHWQNSVHFVAGATAGCIGTIVSFPFDTVRTRLVAQAHHQPVYKGFTSVYSLILRTESLRGFYRGLSPTLIQIAPHTGLQFVFYDLLTDIYKSITEGSSTTVINSLIAGSVAGLLSKTAVYPLDLARKRLQIQGFEHGRVGFGSFFSCHGLLDCLMKTAKTEGLRALFKGLLPSQLKAAATTALHFTFYEQALVLLQYLRV
ncbi:mitochondrial thiamine pyrophosphate carrier [Fopius arisanus]|uniref:Mitochondrial thiamine pyrophosphate carrier n=1 Tax=Fopius arisanus TaxID=64838 RepID=A0A0C9PHI1_9HYME|nr:PREDICTED: mitochondrial thiamine pyrophosphate carrier-like [Fopius arisanus]